MWLGISIAAIVSILVIRYVKCLISCNADCVVEARATNPFGGQNDLGQALCEHGKRICKGSCSLF